MLGVAVRRRSLLLALALPALLVLPAPARAFAPPAVFLKELDGITRPSGPWIPLDGAHMRSVTGYELGVRLQSTGTADNRQRVLVHVNSVPDGHPDQQYVYSLCVFVTGRAGDIVRPDERVTYEGDGRYSVSVTVSTGPDESQGCDQ